MKKVVKGVGARLRKLRVELLEMTQKELAQALGVKQNTISQWEKEERDIPTAVYEALATKFGVNINWLLTGEGEPLLKPRGGTVKKKTFMRV